MPENAGRDQAGRWRKGVSGNPRGKPKGTRNKTTLAAEALLDDQAQALTEKAIEQALDGDMAALRLCLERLSPPRRERLISFELPKLETASDASAAMAAITRGVADGELTASEAETLTRVVDTYLEVVTMENLEKRLEELEQRQREFENETRSSARGV